MSKKLAWVTGSKTHGYELVVTLVDSTLEFHKFNRARFLTYRAAQDIANAVNANVAAKTNRSAKP